MIRGRREGAVGCVTGPSSVTLAAVPGDGIPPG